MNEPGSGYIDDNGEFIRPEARKESELPTPEVDVTQTEDDGEDEEAEEADKEEAAQKRRKLWEELSSK